MMGSSEPSIPRHKWREVTSYHRGRPGEHKVFAYDVDLTPEEIEAGHMVTPTVVYSIHDGDSDDVLAVFRFDEVLTPDVVCAILGDHLTTKAKTENIRMLYDLNVAIGKIKEALVHLVRRHDAVPVQEPEG